MASFCDACRQQTSKHPKRDVSMCAAIMYTVLSIVYQSIAGHVTAAKKTTPPAQLTEGMSEFLQSSNGAALTEVKISCQSGVSNCCRGSKHISRLHLLPFNEVDQAGVESGVVHGKQCLVCRAQFARESRFPVSF